MIIGDRIMRYTILPEHAGRTVSDFLGKRFPYHTAEEWGRFAGAGAVSVNDRTAGADLVLNENDVVGYCASGVTEPRVDEDITILYEDRDIIVVNKTGNLPVHPAGKYFKNTLWAILQDRFDVAEPSIINRLDRETSGVTLVARNSRAAEMCRRQFNCRSVMKKYTALVEGALEGPVHARGYIVNCADSAIRKKRRFEPASGPTPEPGREAEWADTKFASLERHGGVSLLEAVPHTGRLHQIRATLSFLGCPVVGDKMYGLDEGIFLRFIKEQVTPQDAAAMRIGRQALHASELGFSHPSDGHPMVVNAPLPPDMRGLLGI